MSSLATMMPSATIKLISSVMANAVQEGRQGVDAAPEKRGARSAAE